MPESKKILRVRNLKEAKELLRGQRPKRWSFSHYKLHKGCALAFGLGPVLGLRKDEAPSPAMIRGTKIHKEAEYFLKGEIDQVPKSLLQLKFEFKGLKKLRPIVEQFWNVTERFKKAPPYQGWLVLKTDAALPPRDGTAYAFDHKTGKEYDDDHMEQAELTALATWAEFPKAEDVEVEFWYVDQGDVASYRFRPTDKGWLKDKWGERGATVMAERKFMATPSENACKWCPHRTDVGGLCPEWKVLNNDFRRR